MQKKKILHIQVLPKLSGVQTISLEIFKGLSNLEYEKWILFSDKTDQGDIHQCIEEFEKVGVKVIFSSNLKRNIGLKDIPATYEIYKLCRREKFDIVHTHSTKPGIIGRIGAWFAKVPLVIHTVHGIAFHEYVKFPVWQFYWLCEMFSSIFCDKIILVNKYYGKFFKRFAKKTLTIYNGLDFKKFPLQSDENLLTRNEIPIKILYTGRLDNQKDPLSLLAAAKIVCEKHSSALFTIVGDGEKYQECLDFINENSLSSKIKLVGWQTDVAKYYQTHNIFAMSSIYESFGLIFLEAGYYNLPVVATNVEGIPEVVIDNETGFLCDPRDSVSLANNILKLIENKSLRNQMGVVGHNYVLTNFTSDRMVSEYDLIYKQKQ